MLKRWSCSRRTTPHGEKRIAHADWPAAERSCRTPEPRLLPCTPARYSTDYGHELTPCRAREPFAHRIRDAEELMITSNSAPTATAHASLPHAGAAGRMRAGQGSNAARPGHRR